MESLDDVPVLDDPLPDGPSGRLIINLPDEEDQEPEDIPQQAMEARISWWVSLAYALHLARRGGIQVVDATRSEVLPLVTTLEVAGEYFGLRNPRVILLTTDHPLV
jgi:hypothetical protein